MIFNNLPKSIKSSADMHIGTSITSSIGVHGFRYIEPSGDTDGFMQYLNSNSEWVTIEVGVGGSVVYGEEDTYDTSLSYNIGDVCIYKKSLYKCISPTVAGDTFDEVKWEKVTLSKLIGDVANKIHEHDDRYYTEEEIDVKIDAINAGINGKANSNHNHNDSYYDKSYIDNLTSTLEGTMQGIVENVDLSDYYNKEEMDKSISNINDILKRKSNLDHTHEAEDIASVNASAIVGVIDIKNIPHAALERCIVVEDDDARFALTTDQVQVGDTVKVVSTSLMYFVKDDTNLNNEDGYEPYASASKWGMIDEKPDTFPPSDHNHDDRYYTETEIDSKISTVNTSINAKVTLSGGDISNTVVKYTSEDSSSPTAWKNANLLSTGEKISSLFNKISIMFNNIRYLYKLIGTTDISGIADGTITGAIYKLHTLSNGITLEVLSTNWTELSDGTFKNTITSADITGNEVLTCNLYDDGTATDQQKDAYDNLITDMESSAGAVTLYASSKPTVSFFIVLTS